MIRIAGALLFLSLAATTLPRLVVLTGSARALLPLTVDGRRERQMGPWYSSVETLRRALPAKEPVALVSGTRDSEAAVFANYYLYPIRTRLYAGRNEYRNAANDPARPKTIVSVSAQRVERTTYEVLRDGELRAGRRIVSSPKLTAPAGVFILPIAASLDGATPETFVTEATLVNPNHEAAAVRVTFWPKGTVRTFTIAPGATAAYYDFVHQLFDVMDLGWIRIDSSQPLRAAFYFVNRGHADATLLPNVAGAATNIEPATLYRDTKLFLLNLNDAPVNAVIGGTTIPIVPHAFVSWPVARVPAVSGNVYAFVSTRELNGRTDFLWPR